MNGALRRLAVPAAAIAACSLLPGGARALGGSGLEGPFGTGAAAVWILLPKTTIRCIVVFGHGWKSRPPQTRDEWVNQFRPWLDHLVSRGSAVVFPAYQLGVRDSAGSPRVRSFRQGIEIGFARLARPLPPVVVVGDSFGGSLAFNYAANARSWRLPAPAAVDSVFPAGPIGGAPLPRLPATTRVLIQVGDRDTEAGSGGARTFLRWLDGHPPARVRLEVVRSSPSLLVDHAAPKSTTSAARRAFWAPLDRLIDRVLREQAKRG
jgi:pimeloyl-ACP methyl ester carboxylesterase